MHHCYPPYEYNGVSRSFVEAKRYFSRGGFVISSPLPWCIPLRAARGSHSLTLLAAARWLLLVTLTILVAVTPQPSSR